MGVRRMLGFRMRLAPAHKHSFPPPPPLSALSTSVASSGSARRRASMVQMLFSSRTVRITSLRKLHAAAAHRKPLPNSSLLNHTVLSSVFSNFEISVHTMMQLTEGTQCFQVKAPTLAQEKRAQESMWNDGGCYAFVIGVKRSMQHEKWPVTIVGRAQLVFLDSSQASVRWGRGGLDKQHAFGRVTVPN